MSDIERPTAKRRAGPKRATQELSSKDSRIFKAEERKIFAINVMAARLAHGWGISDLARRIDADYGYVYRVEAARLNISIDRMATFATALNHPLHDLLHPRFVSDSKNTVSTQPRSGTSDRKEASPKERRRTQAK